ncbi:hypothetical protein AHF37_08674 [Paragonimus kellicotti]|nr:hypothetical protein AHF37_08674 [Paragonimus kellicotti]
MDSTISCALAVVSCGFQAMLFGQRRPLKVLRWVSTYHDYQAPESSSKPKKSADELQLLEEASDPLLNSLQFLVNWMQNGFSSLFTTVS